MALQWAMDFCGALQRRRDVASPRASRIARVKCYCGFERRIGRCHQVNDPSTHAKANNADSFGVDRAVLLEKIDRRADIGDHAAIAETRAARAHIVWAIGSIAMIEIRRGCDETGVG